MDLEVIPLHFVPGVTQSVIPSDATPPNALEIGSTWYAASAQRTAVNTECKFLLLTHAFEVWKVLRVVLKTDARNTRSRNAIQRIGAKFEGVRRRHSPASDGGVRDAAFFSIIREEWPQVREDLLRKLARQ
jgi:RimJ/RimL family protein N-acetyltransferase